MSPHALEPFRLTAEFWQRDDVVATLDACDIGALFRLMRQRTGASQGQIARVVGLDQPQISKIMKPGPGQRRVQTLDLLTQIADGLEMPDHARAILGLAHRAAPGTTAAVLTAAATTPPDTTTPDQPDDPDHTPSGAFGTALRTLRTVAGLSLAALAKRTNYSRQAISHLETGYRIPTRDMAAALDQTLNAQNHLIELAALQRSQHTTNRQTTAHTAPAAMPLQRSAPTRSTPTSTVDSSALIDHQVGDVIPAGDSWRHLQLVVEQAKALWRSGDAARTVAGTQTPMTGADAVLPLFEWENPPADLDISRRAGRLIGHSELAQVIAARTHYEQMYRRVGGVPVRPRLVNHLTTQIAPMLDGRYDDATGRLLFRAVGGLVAFAGICAYDAEQEAQAVAQRHFFHALRMAKASGDNAFGGYIVALLTNQAIHLGDFRLAIQYAETALRAGQGFLSPALRSDLHAMQAKSYARIGDRTGCHDQLRLAETAAAQVIVENEPAETGYVQPENTQIKHAEALLRLGDTSAARSYAREAVNSDEPFSTRARIYGVATLSMTLAARGEVEESAAHAHRALSDATGVESWRVRDRLRAMVNALAPYHDAQAAQDLIRQADSVLSLPL